VTNLLIDTGAVVALLNAREPAHQPCVDFFSGFQGKIISTESVLTESLYLLGDSLEHQKKCIEFFIQGVRIFPFSPKGLMQCLTLMEKYQDTPMDFADATLTVVAEELTCGDIFTLDRRGFETYRWARNRPFKIYPENRS